MITRRVKLKKILGRVGVLGYVKAILRMLRKLNPYSAIARLAGKIPYPLKKQLFIKLMTIAPNSSWAHEQLLSLSCANFSRDPLGASADFASCFNAYLKLKPNSIFKWRRQSYGSFMMRHDQVGMQQMMQAYVDTQEAFVRDHQLDVLGVRFADNLLLANYNTHAYLDTQIKAMLLGWQPRHKIIALLRPGEIVCNPVMLEYWRAYIEVLDNEAAIKMLAPVADYLQDDLSYTANLKGRAVYIEYAKHLVQKQWEAEGRKPLHQLSQEDCDFGWDQLQRLGLPKGAWFVSLHVRDSGCKLGSHLAKDDIDGFRNADIDSYQLAIQSIVARGGYVVRVGDQKMKPMAAMKGVIDYALSGINSNRMDIFLFTQCRFFFGVSSGPILTPVLFGVPTIMSNFAPMIGRPHASNCLFIPKLLWLRDENRYATFHEVLSSDLGRIFSSAGFEEKNIRVIDNSPEELNELAVEMLDRLDGCCVYSNDDENLQQKLNALYQSYSGYGDLGRVGRGFIKKYAELGLLG